MYESSDYDGFTKVLEKLALVFGKKLEDGLVEAYWGALKDQTLTTVTQLAERHMRTSKFWPKPAELRPKDAISPETDDDGKFREGKERAMRGLEEMRRKDPKLWMELMEHRTAGAFAREFGIDNIYFDIPSRCWRRVQ